MSKVSEILVQWTPQTSERVAAVQFRSRVKGTTAWTEQAANTDPKAGMFLIQNNAAGAEIEVEYRTRMTTGVFGAWTRKSIVTEDIITDNADLEAAVNDAKNKANQAALDAAAAKARADAIAADGILDVGEKQQVIREFAALTLERARLVATANALSITTELTPFTNAYSALKTYLEGLTPSYDNLSADSPIVRATYNQRWGDVADTKATLYGAIDRKASLTANYGQVTGTPTSLQHINESQFIAVFGADGAVAKANQVRLLVDEISADNKLDPSEKVQVFREFGVIVSEYDAIRLRASDRQLTQHGTYLAFVNARTDLESYLNGLNPSYTNYTVSTTIDRATFTKRFNDYYSERTKLFTVLDSTAKIQEDKALTALERIAADGWLTRGEKREVEIEWFALNDRLTAAHQRYTDFGNPADVTTARQNAANAIDPGNQVDGSLGRYLSTLTPAWNDRSQDTPINATTWTQRFRAAYNAMAIYEAALTGQLSGEAKQVIESLKLVTNDSVWTPQEKRNSVIPNSVSLETLYTTAMNESDYMKTTSQVSVARSALTTARDNWINYRGGLRPFWNDLTQPTTIDRDQVNLKLEAYRAAIDKIATAMTGYTDFRATFAVNRVNAISSDAILSMGEKPAYVQDWQVLNATYDALNIKNRDLQYPSQASASANAARNAIDPSVPGSLGAYLQGLSPRWDDATSDTPIDAATFLRLWVRAESALAQYQIDLGAIPGKDGKDGTSTTVDPTSASTSYNGQTITHGWKGPAASLTLNAGQSATIEVFLNLSTNSSVSVYGYIQVFKSNGEYVTNAAGPTTAFVNPGEPDSLYVSGTFQNNSGTRQAYNFHGYTLLDPSAGRTLAAGGGSSIQVSK